MLQLMIYLFFASTITKAEEGCRVLQVDETYGRVVIDSKDGVESESIELSVGDSIEVGETIRTGEDSWVDLRFCDGGAQRVTELSEFTYSDANESMGFLQWSFTLGKGAIRAILNGDGEQIKYRVKTPTASLGVRGTEFLLEANEEETSLHTLDGKVLFGSSSDWDQLNNKIRPDLRARFTEVGKNFYSFNKKGQRPQKPQGFDRENLQNKRLKSLILKELKREKGFRFKILGKRNVPIFRKNRSKIERRGSLQNRPKKIETKRGNFRRNRE
jgi:hypothetical protein